MRDWNLEERVLNGKDQTGFVAYLWGIETCKMRYIEHSAFGVCSLPMRDWNYPKYLGYVVFPAEFVAYLWGIETSQLVIRCHPAPLFVAYLWGIETHTCALQAFDEIEFVAYLWGIETVMHQYDQGNLLSSL